MWGNPERYFNPNQYIMGDSTFENHWLIVSALTCSPGGTLPYKYSFFNTHLSKCHVISEHTIGLFKGRFPWLHSIRKMITYDTDSLREILALLMQQSSYTITHFAMEKETLMIAGMMVTMLQQCWMSLHVCQLKMS